MDAHARSTHCHDCGAPLTGPYCAACGQKDQEKIVPFGHLLHEVFHDLAHLDARFLRTLGALLKPGLLTEEYLAGRRTRWYPPFRLYLMVSLVFFALAALGPATTQFSITTRPHASVVGVEGKADAPPRSALESRLEARAVEINRDPAPFVAKLMAWAPRVLFLLLPLFALLLKLAYLRSRILYAAHAIFSLHLHAYAFLLFTAMRVLGFVPYVRGLRGLLLLALPVYLVVALKRVYGQGWLASTLKAVGVGALHLLGTLTALVLTTLGLMLFSH